MKKLKSILCSFFGVKNNSKSKVLVYDEFTCCYVNSEFFYWYAINYKENACMSIKNRPLFGEQISWSIEATCIENALTDTSKITKEEFEEKYAIALEFFNSVKIHQPK